MSDKAPSQTIWCYNKHIHGKKHEINRGQRRPEKTLPHPAREEATPSIIQVYFTVELHSVIVVDSTQCAFRVEL